MACFTAKKHAMNLNEIATKSDIQELKESILESLKQSSGSSKPRKWLRSKDVEKMLSISSSGLQNMRIKGTIPFIKLDGTILYEYEDILQILENRKSKAL